MQSGLNVSAGVVCAELFWSRVLSLLCSFGGSFSVMFFKVVPCFYTYFLLIMLPIFSHLVCFFKLLFLFRQNQKKSWCFKVSLLIFEPIGKWWQLINLKHRKHLHFSKVLRLTLIKALSPLTSWHPNPHSSSDFPKYLGVHLSLWGDTSSYFYLTVISLCHTVYKERNVYSKCYPTVGASDTIISAWALWRRSSVASLLGKINQ